MQLADLQRRDERELLGQAVEVFRFWSEPLPEGVSLPVLALEPLALRRRLWRYAIAAVRGHLDNIGFTHLEAIRTLPRGQQVHLPGVRVLHEADRLALPRRAARGGASGTHSGHALDHPRRLRFPAAGCCLHLEAHARRLPIECGDAAVLDAGAVRGAVARRSWQPGDRFRPLGAPGERKGAGYLRRCPCAAPPAHAGAAATGCRRNYLVGRISHRGSRKDHSGNSAQRANQH